MGWIVLGLVLLLSALNVPIGFVLAVATIIVVSIQGTAPLAAIPLMIFGGASKFPLLAIPLFILAGGLMTTTGISTRLINLASALVGFIRGGLAMVTIVASMFFGEISGSAVAGAADLGFGGGREGTAGVVEHHVEPAEFLDRPVHQCLHLGRIGDVSCLGDCTATRCRDGLVELGSVDIGGDHGAAFGGEGLEAGQANAAGGAEIGRAHV